MTLAMLLPFAVLVVLAPFGHAHPAAAATEPVKTGFLTGLLAVLWNYMGWDNASTIAGEVERPQRTYPLAMLFSVLLVAATYIIPVAAVSHSGIPPQNWETGSWVEVGKTIGGNAIGPHVGNGLGWGIMIGGMISAFSMFNALILSYSRVPLAMAADGFLPKFMAWRNRKNGVPWVSLIVCAVFWGICIRLGFLRLLILDTMLYGLSLILEFAALIALRLREPDLSRPYRVPGGLAGCILISLLPIPLMGIAFYQSLSDDDARRGLITAAILVALGIVMYFVAIVLNPRLRRRDEPPPRGFEVVIRGQNEPLADEAQ